MKDLSIEKMTSLITFRGFSNMGQFTCSKAKVQAPCKESQR